MFQRTIYKARRGHCRRPRDRRRGTNAGEHTDPDTTPDRLDAGPAVCRLAWWSAWCLVLARWGALLLACVYRSRRLAGRGPVCVRVRARPGAQPRNPDLGSLTHHSWPPDGSSRGLGWPQSASRIPRLAPTHRPAPLPAPGGATPPHATAIRCHTVGSTELAEPRAESQGINRRKVNKK